MKELAVPVILLAVLASMLLPVPPQLLDLLIVGNLGLSLLLLLSSLCITDTLRLSALPTLLLISTIYRLSLNIASTRLILGSGEAGHVIEAFGAIVIDGNLVVGAVVFMIITLVQFMVIAKGSERVAEVAARFALDALPGKQMSIDADVRAGLIDFETARKRRQEMQTESRFYGALDGAMKFVKGDAIAGIIIALVNVAGGLVIAIFIDGIKVQQALLKYTVLTVGDGLVSQVPALLSALAAGIVVTRVARGDGNTVSQELLSQLGQFKSAKLIIAAFCVVFMFIPGMPLIPFACMASFLLISSMLFSEKSIAVKSEECRFEPKRVPLLEIVTGACHMAEPSFSQQLSSALNLSRNNIFEQTGIMLPPPEIVLASELKNEFLIRLRGSKIASNNFNAESKEKSAIIAEAFFQACLDKRAELADDIMSRRLLDFLDKDHPELVSSVIPGCISITRLTEILKALLREQISIRQLDLILQGIAESAARTENARMLVEDVRVMLGRSIVTKYIQEDGRLHCYVLDSLLDVCLVKTERGSQDLPAEALTRLSGELRVSATEKLVIVASKGARALLKECLRLRKAAVEVLAHEEIPEDISLNVLAVVGRGDHLYADQLLEQLAA